MVPNWFNYVFTYSGDNHALEGLLNAIELVMQTGFALAAFIAIFLNLFLKEEVEAHEVELVTGERAGMGSRDGSEGSVERVKEQGEEKV